MRVKSPDVSGLVLYINLIWAFLKSHILVTFLKAAVQGANILLIFLFDIERNLPKRLMRGRVKTCNPKQKRGIYDESVNRRR